MLYEYRCATHGVFEAWNTLDNRYEALCPECKMICPKIMSAPRVKLDPLSGDFPGATMSWKKKREEKMRQEVKQDKTHIE